MENILAFFQEFVNLGATVLLPFVIAVLGKFFGMKAGHAVKSGLLVGIGFQGLVLAVNLLITSVQPVMDYYKSLGSGYDALEVGFAALFFAQWLAPQWGEFFGLEGTTCTTLAFCAWIYPVTYLINKLIDRIPVLNKADVNVDKIGKKLGLFGDPSVIGLFVGVLLAILTRQDLSSVLTIGVGVAASMVLIPRMVSIMMEGLTPMGNAANDYMHKKVGEDADIYIGMDIALGLGDPACITCSAIMIPVTILLAFLVPGMRFFPLGILAEVCYLAPMCVLTSKGNIFRTLICMSIMMYMTLCFANMFIPEATQMMSVTGVDFDGLVTASHFGWNPGNLIVSFLHKLFGMFG